MLNLNPWVEKDLIQIVNKYLNINLTREEFLKHQFTGSEIIEAINTQREYQLGVPWYK